MPATSMMAVVPAVITAAVIPPVPAVVSEAEGNDRPAIPAVVRIIIRVITVVTIRSVIGIRPIIRRCGCRIRNHV